MGYTQRYDFVALYKKEHWKYNYFLNHEQYKSDFRKISGFCSALDEGIYDIRALYPSTLDDMTKKLPKKYEQKKISLGIQELDENSPDIPALRNIKI